MSSEYHDYMNANYGPEDEPTREEQEGDAWEYWHQRAIKLEAENARLKAALLPCAGWLKYAYGHVSSVTATAVKAHLPTIDAALIAEERTAK